MATTLVVTLRQSEGGGHFEFAPEPKENLRWETTKDGRLILRRAQWDDEKEIFGEHKVFRIFSHGTWADVEIVD